ncbi:putative membrane protein [Shimia gijangensis]|uniref:Putative membrane protein n=1 Tax=Shimia gijangensis TaxID=1470563 RepID=A0A1M6CXN6_9RHOB|nr:TIGR01620 family protein [Shimia gijangensis]SHI65564.1 putative membrane protein [Shimia gijangensis]
MTSGPILIDLETKPGPNVADAPPVPDVLESLPDGQAMQVAAQLAAQRPSRLARWFWSLLVLILGMVVSVAAWDFATGLIARSPMLGWVVTGLVAALALIALGIALRELAGFARLRRVDAIRSGAEAALGASDVKDARRVLDQLIRLYQGREDTAWGRERLAERQGDLMDADALLGLAEVEVLAPLDKAAMREIEAAARQVATVTALVPLTLADVVVALTSNVGMIRRIAETYGGRSGALGSWRLLRAVMTHLVATGAVAVGDDLIGTLAGGGALAKVSRRFGEGLINGVLTARVGVAAMEVCRPLPFAATKRPSVTKLVKSALTGLFTKGG